MEKKNQAGNVKQKAGQFGTEFVRETNAQEVRKQNQQTKSKK